MDQMDYEMHPAEVPTTQAPPHPAHSGFQVVPQGHGGCPYFRNEQHHHQPSLPHLHPSYPPYHPGVNSLYHSPRQNHGPHGPHAPHAPRSSHSRNLSLQPHHRPQQPGHGQPQQHQTQNPPLSLPLPHSHSQSHSHSHSLSHPHQSSHYDPVYNPGWTSSTQSSGPAFQWTATPAPAPGPPPSHAAPPLLSIPLPLQSLLRPSSSEPFSSGNGAGNSNPNGPNSGQSGFHSTQNLPHLDSAGAPSFSFPYRHPAALHRFSVAPGVPSHHSHPNLSQAPPFPQAPTQNQNQQNYQSQPSRVSLPSSSGTMNHNRPPAANTPSAQPSQALSNTTMSSEPNVGTALAPLNLPQLPELSGQSNRGLVNSGTTGQLPRPSQLEHVPVSRPPNHGGDPAYRSVSDQRREAIRRAQSLSARAAAIAEDLARRNGDDFDESEEDYSPVDEDDEAYHFATQFVPHGYMGGEENRLRQQQLLRGQLSTSKRVASKKALTSLQSVDMKTLTESEKVCVICYNEFGVTSPEGVNEAPLRLPKCKHIFGDHCIKKWFEESDSCPYCRDKVPSEPSIPQHILQHIRVRNSEFSMTHGNAAGEPGTNRFASHPASRTFQTGERRSSPPDPSTDNMRRPRARIGGTRSYHGAPPNLTSPMPHPPSHAAFLASITAFPGPAGPPPAGAFQPSGPSVASGEPQMSLPSPSVFFPGPFTQESSVGLTGQLLARGQRRVDMGSTNSNMGRGHLRPETTNHNSCLTPVPPYPPLGGPLRHNPALLPRPELRRQPLNLDLNALTYPFSEAVRDELISSGVTIPLQPRPSMATASLTRAYSDDDARWRISEELLADLEAYVGRDPFGGLRSNNSQPQLPGAPTTASSVPPPSNSRFTPSSRGEAGEPPRKRRRSGSAEAGTGEEE
ncbi:hypothetical protein QBC40DRAFT_108830 [Triangularia verruculosa]|uniref:RING-type domain-containing protein n=1 Tax=Triangularia verruculosa TaxID=2587418 RepID=A0AAN6XAS1_9PEZI|nr:hypothetical protein QBC40DRAFT_108830 [Triangularia verruculosa]